MSNQVKPVRGLTWGVSAIGNAVWTGVRLRDILKAAKIQVDEEAEGGFKSPHGVEHVVFEGLDKDLTNATYGASVSLETAYSPQSEVIVAYEMNGEPLSRDHGFPVRVVVPGVIGARSVKWLSKITASQKESESFWQKKDYKVFDPSIDWNNVDFLKEEAVQTPNVQSVVCDYQFDEDSLVVKGYAWSGGGRRIKRVDVSADGGVTWQVAEILPVPESHKPQKVNHGWAWSLWTATIPATKLHKQQTTEKDDTTVKVCCKATDESFNVQPESADSIWNLRGLLCNSRHCVSIKTDSSKQ
jgi:sulfite oxidase